MNIGLLGGYGQLGTQFRRTAKETGHRVVAPTSAELDITDKQSVADWVQATRADAWVNAAAFTAVDAAEDNPQLAHAVNATGAANLSSALVALRLSSPLVYTSTDYVFAGTQGAPFNEQATTDPRSVYGASKLAGEQASRAYDHSYILRISWVFGVDGHNFVKAILRAARRFDRARDASGNAEALRVVDDQYGAPCGTPSIAETILALLTQAPAPGIYHFANAPHANWHEFAEAIVAEAVAAGLLSQPVEVLTQPTSALNQKALRPPDGRLDASKLQRTLNLEPTEWRDELRRILARIDFEQLDD